MDYNAKYLCRLIEKAPVMNMKKNEMIAFMSKYDIEIPNPVPTKSVLLEKILIILKNIEKQNVIDSMAKTASYSVLRLPPYHCILNPIEMARNQLKYYALHLNVYTNKPLKGVNLIQKVCKENISTEKLGLKKRKSFVSWTIFLITEPFIIHLCENDDVNDS